MFSNWIDDQAGLAALKALGIRVYDAVIPVISINKKASAENRARKEPLDESRVEGIVSARQRNIPIPKIVVRKSPKLGNVIAGGNHRFAGLNGEVNIPVHMIECTDAEFEIACKVLNTVVGVGMTKEERVEAAMDAYQRLGVDKQNACKIYGVAESSLQDAIRKRELALRLRDLPSHVRSNMTPSHFRALGELGKNDNVFRAASILVGQTKLPVAQLNELAKEAREQKTEAGQVLVFEKHLQHVEKEKSAVVPRKIKKAFLMAVSSVCKFKENKTWESLEITKQEVAEIKAQARTAISILSGLCREDG